MSAITFLVVASTLGADPSWESAKPGTRGTIQLAQAFSTPAYSSRPVQTRHEGSFSRLADRGFGSGPEVPQYSPATNHGMAADDLPDRPRLDLIPFLDRTQLGSSNRRTGFDSAIAQRPNNSSFASNGNSSFTSNGSNNSYAQYGQPNTAGANNSYLGSSVYAQPTNQGQMSNQTSFGQTQPGYNQYPPLDYRPATNQQNFGFGANGNHSGTSTPNSVLVPPTTSNWNDPWQNSSGRNLYGSNGKTPTTSLPPIPYRDGFDNGYHPPTYNSDPHYQSAQNSGFPSRGYGQVESYDRLANHGYPPATVGTDPYRDNRLANPSPLSTSPTSGFDFNRSKLNLPTASISRNSASPGFSTTFASLLLFASLGGNLYLGWLARDFYWRYRDLAWETRGNSHSAN